MSAPTSHDPVAVNTQDGSCWTRRAVTREGRGLYALASVKGDVPELVLASLPELAEHGLASMQMFALPMPAGGELERLRAEVAELRAERKQTNEWVDDAAKALRADRDRIAELETDLAAKAQDAEAAVAGWGRARDRIAELEALTPARHQTCRKCGAGYVYGEPCAHCEFRARMEAAAQARVRQPYRAGHDLPETGGTK